jgi:hypothetical protein
MDNVLTQFAKGETRYGGVNIPDSGDWDTSIDNSNFQEGAEADVQYELKKTVAGVQSAPRNWKRRIMVVRNAGATTLAAGDAVKWSAGFHRRRVEKNASAEGKCAGIVIDVLTSNGCVQYDMCAIVRSGPCWATKATGDGGIAEGVRVIATSGGKVESVSAPSDAQDAFDFACRKVGTAIVTAATGASTVLINVEANE